MQVLVSTPDDDVPNGRGSSVAPPVAAAPTKRKRGSQQIFTPRVRKHVAALTISGLALTGFYALCHAMRVYGRVAFFLLPDSGQPTVTTGIYIAL